MAVEITRRDPVVLPPPTEVQVTSAAWPNRRVKLICHDRGVFGQVKAPSVSLHFNWTNNKDSWSAGACYTLDEARELVAAFSEAIEALDSL